MAFRVIILLVSLHLIHAAVQDLSCEQVRQFVDGHNSRRLQLARGKVGGQPGASVMKKMVWDEELAAKARNWAKNNQFMHNPDTNIGSGRFRTGENLYIYSTTDKNYKLNVDSGLKSWWDEHKDYHYRVLQGSDFGGSKMIGHYTQMAWSDSIYVGCAVSRYSANGWENFLTVCNYGPSGNWIGQTPYPAGGPTNVLTCAAGDCSRAYGDRC